MTPEQIFLVCRIPSLPCSFPGTMVSLFSGTVPTGTHSCWKFSCLLNVFCSWCHMPLCSHPVLCSSFYQTPGKGGLRSLSAFICCSLRKLPQTNVCPHCDTKTALAKARANQGPFFLDLNLSAALALAGPSHLLTSSFFTRFPGYHILLLYLSSLTSLALNFFSADFPLFQTTKCPSSPRLFLY